MQWNIRQRFFHCLNEKIHKGRKLNIRRVSGVPTKNIENSAEIDAQRTFPAEKNGYKRKFETKGKQIIPKHQTHIHDKNVRLS